VSDELRIDRWLWAVRIFKTRTQAINACRAGHVKINGISVKPSHQVKVGEVISVQIGELNKTIRVTGLLSQRVGAQVAKQYVEDLTPPEEYAKLKEKRESTPIFIPPGYGRPTKRDRRLMRKFGLID
jgi:ribosome-associated heat shock protein Hsp15